MRIFENLHIDFLGKRNFFYIVSALLFLAGFLNIIFRGLEFGIDFKGGSEIVLQFEKPVDIAQVRNYVENIGLGNVELKTFGGETGVLVRTEMQNIPESVFPRVVEGIEQVIDTRYSTIPRNKIESGQNTVVYEFPNSDTTNRIIDQLNSSGFQAARVNEEFDNRQMIVSVGISDWIKENLHQRMPDNQFRVLRQDQVGPKIGSELKQDALIAVALSLIVILVYLAFRFKFIFALGAVVALFHDVLITLGLFSLLYNVIPGLNLEIDLTIVAAFLTLVGYSINDTVIVFDRVRENLKIHKTMPLKDILNMSINRTMSRTILTGGTTLLSIFVLLLFGGEVLRAFAFTLFFGIVIGTYSSIFVASALVLDYAERSKKKIQF
jgi:preprotein translocase subunit SecF